MSLIIPQMPARLWGTERCSSACFTHDVQSRPESYGTAEFEITGRHSSTCPSTDVSEASRNLGGRERCFSACRVGREQCFSACSLLSGPGAALYSCCLASTAVSVLRVLVEQQSGVRPSVRSTSHSIQARISICIHMSSFMCSMQSMTFREEVHR